MAWREELLVGNLTVTGKAPMLSNKGTVVSGTTEQTYTSDGVNFVTKLVCTGFTVDTAAAAALGLGNKVWTFPTGDIIINGASMVATATPSGTALNGDQPYIGVGTVVASGAVSDLTGTATFDNIVEQDQVNAVFAGAVAKTSVQCTASNLNMLAAGAHTVYLNIADTWAAQDAALAMAATINIAWSLLTN